MKPYYIIIHVSKLIYCNVIHNLYVSREPQAVEGITDGEKISD